MTGPPVRTASDGAGAALAAALRAAGCVFAEDEAALLTDAATGPVELDAMLERRIAGEPLEQIVGWAEFCGLRIVVRPGVFVPRRRSALLVREALPLVPPGGRLLDVCCGTGAVAAAIGAARDDVEVHAADSDPVAVGCARDNLAAYGGHAYEGDLYAPVPERLRGSIDVVVANAPYVPTDAIPLMPPEARLYEPRTALDGGADGLDVQRRVIEGAADWLCAGGQLLVETSVAQAPLTAAALARHGFEPRVSRDEELDATAVIGIRARR